VHESGASLLLLHVQAMGHIRKSPKYVNRRAQLVAEFEAKRADDSAAVDARRQGAAQRQRRKQPASAQQRRSKGAASTLNPEEQKEVEKQLESEVTAPVLVTHSTT